MTGTILLILYAIIIVIIAVSSWKYNNSVENYLIAGRKQHKVLIVASMLASTIGGALTIGQAGKTYSMGFPAIWFILAGAIAHFAQGTLLSKKVRETEALTLSDMALKLVGPRVQFLTSLFIVITWTAIAAGQFIAVAKILVTITGITYKTGVIISASFLIVYTIIGGQKSILKTDLFQFGILSIALMATLIFLYTAKPVPAGSIAISLFTTQFTFWHFLHYLIVIGGSYFICPMMFSRILSADTPQNARKSSFISGTGMLIFAFVITFIGLWAKASIPDLQKLDPLNYLAKNTLPSALGILLIFGLLAAILSTADTVLITGAGTLQNDIIKRKSVTGIRVFTILIGLVAMLIALFKSDIIAIIIKTYNGYTAGVVPALFIALLFKGKRILN
ncbi:MAG TPA: sodium:solute symporter family protein [Spirochaetales bacterium]|nr:sodium:solute symporter family protein [Spirochaetales bacterium]